MDQKRISNLKKRTAASDGPRMLAAVTTSLMALLAASVGVVEGKLHKLTSPLHSRRHHALANSTNSRFESPPPPPRLFERTCFAVPPARHATEQGQVTNGTSFGIALREIASRPDVLRILEIGTWYGGGSTLNLGRAIRDTAQATLTHAMGENAPARNCVEHGSGAARERCCHSLVFTLEVHEPTPYTYTPYTYISIINNIIKDISI